MTPLSVAGRLPDNEEDRAKAKAAKKEAAKAAKAAKAEKRKVSRHTEVDI